MARKLTLGIALTCVGPPESGMSDAASSRAAFHTSDRRLEYELPELGLHRKPGQQPVFIGYGNDDLLAHHAVFALDHLVRKAPRALVAEQGGAVCAGGLLGPRQQRKRLDRGVQAAGCRYDLLPAQTIPMLKR